MNKAFLISIYLLGSHLALSQNKSYTALIHGDRQMYSFSEPKPNHDFEAVKTRRFYPDYKLHYGVFCKIEDRFSEKAGFPVRMRLGNLEYVNNLELKVPAYKRILLESDFK